MTLPANRVMLDPSIVLSEAGLHWLESEEAASTQVVVPERFRTYLEKYRDPVFFPMLSDERQEHYGLYRDRALAVIDDRGIDLFGYTSVDLPAEVAHVTGALLEAGGLEAEMLADMWTFAQSQSWILSATKKAIDAMRRYGAWVADLGEEWTLEMAKAVVKDGSVPDALTAGFALRVGAKYIAWGTAVVGGSLAGIAAGTTIAGPPGATVGAIAGWFYTEKAVAAGFVRWDP